MTQETQYPAYQATGVEWLPRLPEHWRMIKLRHTSKSTGGGTPDRSNLTYWGGDIPWVTPKDMKSQVIESSEEAITARGLAASPTNLIDPGAVLLVFRSGILKHTIPVAINSRPVVVNQDIRAYTFTDDLLPEFFLRYVQGLNSTLLGFWCKQGSTVESIEGELIESSRLPIPPRQEQERIVRYLEAETARIDALIEKKTRFIELLKEKRQALITQAVTKGLAPNVPMKDSGVEWIGEVPEHWSPSKIRFVARERGGKTPSKDNLRYWHGDVPWVSPKDMKADVVTGSIDRITTEAVRECGMSLLSAGTILVVVRGMILAHSFPVAETATPVTINQDMKALTPASGVSATFFRLLLQSVKQVVVDVLVAEAAHGTRVLRTDIWKQLPIFLPPLSEQLQIVERIAAETAKLDSLIAVSERSIALLKERRSALITAAVTGQIDLRESA